MKNELGHYIYGRRAVNEALNAGRLIEKIFIQFGSDGDIIEEIRMKARQKNVACSIADKMKFNDMEKRIPLERGSAQGVIALTPLLTYSDIYELIDTSLASQNYPMLIALDEISDPFNVGAIARSAECSGISGMILPVDNTSPITPAAFKSAAGALEFLPVSKADNLVIAIRNCKAAGFTIIGTAGTADITYTDPGIYEKPIVLIIGSEGKGIRPAIWKECDAFITIPVKGNIESLNASAAAAIIMFERNRQLNHT